MGLRTEALRAKGSTNELQSSCWIWNYLEELWCAALRQIQIHLLSMKHNKIGIRCSPAILCHCVMDYPSTSDKLLLSSNTPHWH